MENRDSLVIREKLWNGSINIRILLNVSNDKEKEFLLVIYRNSYFSIHFPAMVAYFQAFVPKISSTAVWLEYENVPIKWNIPVGLLYDHLHLSSTLTKRESVIWTLSLKYGEYPSEYIIPFVYKNQDLTINYIKSFQETLLNQLKQSCFVLNGNSKAIMTLSEKDTNNLIDSIKCHDLKEFVSIERKILPYKFQRIPVKIYIPGSSNTIQAPISPIENQNVVYLNNVLQKYLPNLFGDKKVASIYMHGINADFLLEQDQISLIDIWQIFKHLDNFLYIVVIVNN